ncbi:MAG: hypothetical protein JKP97_00260 [Rhodobacteraceae bacterium]|jgi:hypothetical protein|nr:hypothetical protein [Paracoccaceae bacterium]
MHDADVKPLSKLAIDPQPRRDLEIPPMVQVHQPQGVRTATAVEPKRQAAENLFAGLDFSA